MNQNSRRRSQHKKGNYAFIDSQNLNLGVQRLGWKLDWRKFLHYLQKEHGVVNAYMFIGHVPENEDLYIKMHDIGYLVVLKPTFDMTRPMPEVKPEQEGEEKKPIKGNVDAELVLWAVKEMPNYHKAVIVSGDGDFFSLVDYLQEEDKLHKLITPNRSYSNLLRKFQDSIIRVDQQKRTLQYRVHPKK